MDKICVNCGCELRDSAKFCGKCGTKVNEIKYRCKKCGRGLEIDTEYCSQCKQFSGTDKKGLGKEQNRGFQGAQNWEQREAPPLYTGAIQDKSEGFIGNAQAYNMPQKKKKGSIGFVLLGLVVIVNVLIVAVLFNVVGGVSNKVVSQAALQIAEQDFGYKLELVSYDVVDSFTAKNKNLMSGKNIKSKIYLVIIEAEAKDTDGEVAETVKYAISVVEPKKSGGYVSYSPLSQAEDCTDMEKKDIEEWLLSYAAAYR